MKKCYSVASSQLWAQALLKLWPARACNRGMARKPPEVKKCKGKKAKRDVKAVNSKGKKRKSDVKAVKAAKGAVKSKPPPKKAKASEARASKSTGRHEAKVEKSERKREKTKSQGRPQKKPAARSTASKSCQQKPSLGLVTDSSQAAGRFASSGFVCELPVAEKVEARRCDRCGVCIRGLCIGSDALEAQWFHADCFLHMHPEAKALATGFVAQFSMLAPEEQSSMLEFLHGIHVSPERRRQLQTCPTEDYAEQEASSQKAVDERIAGHKELVSQVNKELASSQLNATLSHQSIPEIRAAVELAEQAQVRADLPALLLAKQHLRCHDGLGNALRNRDVADLDAAEQACLQCGLHPNTHKTLAAAQEQGHFKRV